METGASVLLVAPLFHHARIWDPFRVCLTELGAVVEAVDPAEPPVRGYDVVVAASTSAETAVSWTRQGEVQALVLIDPNSNWPLPEVPMPALDERLTRHLARMPEGLVEAAETGDAETFADLLVQVISPHLAEQHVELVRRVLSDSAPRVFAAAHPQEPAVPWGPAHEWADELGMLTVPVLGIASVPGQADDDLRQRIVAALANRCLRGSYATVSSHTDYPWLESPQALAALIIEFAATTVEGEQPGWPARPQG